MFFVETYQYDQWIYALNHQLHLKIIQKNQLANTGSSNNGRWQGKSKQIKLNQVIKLKGREEKNQTLTFSIEGRIIFRIRKICSKEKKQMRLAEYGELNNSCSICTKVKWITFFVNDIRFINENVAWSSSSLLTGFELSIHVGVYPRVQGNKNQFFPILHFWQIYV